MKYSKSTSIQGKWVKGGEVQSSVKARLVSEAKPIESQFKNKDGSTKFQDVAKILFQGASEPLNISLNRATVNGLVDAFGENSSTWQNKTLTVITEKVRVAGKAVTAVYLVPEGYEKVDDQNGYAVIVKVGEKVESPEELPEIPW